MENLKLFLTHKKDVDLSKLISLIKNTNGDRSVPAVQVMDGEDSWMFMKWIDFVEFIGEIQEGEIVL